MGGLEGTAVAITLACAACGSRTALDILSGDTRDAAGTDVSIEAAEAACSATIPLVRESQNGDPSCCRFDVIWTCGNRSFRVGSACCPQMALVVCPQNDQQLSGPAPMACHCDDTSALSAFVETRCHPTAVR